MRSTSRDSLFGKGRRAEEPGAKVGMDDGAAGNPPRSQYGTISSSNARGAITANFQGLNSQTFQGNRGGNFRGNVTRIFQAEPTRALCFELTTNDWNKLSGAAMREYMEAEDITVKELAQRIGCNDRTAENYVAGRNSPSGLHFLRSIAIIGQFEMLVREVAAMATGDTDPQVMRKALKFAEQAATFLQTLGIDPGLNSPDNCTSEGRDPLTGDLFMGRH